MSSHRRLWVAAAIIAVVLLGGFALSVPRAGDVEHAPVAEESTGVPPVTLSDVFKKGTHTITGSLKVPNVCTTVTAIASAIGDDTSNPKEIRIAVSLTKDDGICLQVPTTLNFSTTVVAPARIPLSATVNGAAATTTVL